MVRFFKHNVETSLKTKAYYPINEMQSILSLSGNTSMSISDLGAIRIAMDSGLANYEYIFPCLTCFNHNPVDGNKNSTATTAAPR